MAVKNRAVSTLARLKNQAKTEGINYQMCLQLFFQEEFLRRLSHSKYKENLVLKGGMLIYTLTDFDSRPTRDMDFLVRSLSNDRNNIKTVMGEFMGHINNVRVPFSVDVGIDDIIVPDAMVRRLSTRLDGFESPEIYTYSLESTISEKLDAILQRMETTSRMKDFFDIYYLSSVFDFAGNPFLKSQWLRFEPAKAAGLEFSETLRRLEQFLHPVYQAVLRDEDFDGQWFSSQKSWTCSNR